jgi:uncharacterized lipoprotein NlpE involved in copper resistance
MKPRLFNFKLSSLRLLSLITCLVIGISFAQGTISGTVSASDVTGFVVIACYADATVGCNESLSSVTELSGPGYQLGNLSAGQYIVFLWRDTNNSGELEEDQDEVHYYAADNEEVTLISPPAQNIDFNLVSAAAPTPAASANTQELVGSWSTLDYFGTYVDAGTGAYAGSANTGNGVIFNADGTYSMTDYYDLDGICQWFRSKGNYQVKDNLISIQTLENEMADCGDGFVPQASETRYYLWRFNQGDNGVRLELLPAKNYRDERDWFYANSYSRVIE